MNPLKLIESDIPVTTGKQGIIPEILTIINELLLIHERGKSTPLLFTNRFPKANKPYTKTLLQASHFIHSLYYGTFTREYQVSSEFLSKNHQYISQKTWEKLSTIKGSWDLVSDSLFEAAKNYRQWFWIENEPESKDWLPHDLSVWLFDRYKQSSIFLVCLLEPPYPVREVKVDRIYNTIPPKIRKIADDLYCVGWDACVFWCKIADIVAWYNTKSELSDRNLRYWFDSGLVSWFTGYVEWLKQFDSLYLKQIGVNNATWTAWCVSAAKEHGFSVKVLGL